MDAAAVTAWIDEQVERHEFSGVALVWREGEPIFSYAGGLAHRGHGVPVTASTRFPIASVTKMITAATALSLVDSGALALDRPLADILPAEHRPRALTQAHTLHHLLSHTSGFADYHDDSDPTWDSFTSNWDRVPTYRARRPADLLPLFADLPAVGAPGDAYRYTDANFVLAGLAIEAAAGAPYPDVAAERVLGPGGMTASTFAALDEEPAGLASAYVMDDGPPERWRTNVFSVPAAPMPDGGLGSTADDLARFVDALLGGRLVSPALVEAMLRPQGPAEGADDAERYGYGMELGLVDGRVMVAGHNGSDPGVSAVVAHHLDAATTIVVLCNQDRGGWAVNVRLATELDLVEPRG